MINVTIKGEVKQYPQGTTYEAIAEEYQHLYENRIVLVIANGKIRELFKKLNYDCELDFIPLGDAIGSKTYDRTATMLLLKAIYDLYGEEAAQNTRVEFVVGNGTYVKPAESVPATAEAVAKIKARMQELVEAKVPYFKKSYPMDDAMALFKEHGMEDKITLFRYRRSSFVNIYELDGYFDYYYGFMCPHTGYVQYFDLMPYDEGIMLLLPRRTNPTVVEPFQDRPKLFATFKESEEWCQTLGISTVGELNDKICQGKVNDMILVAEALQERRIGEIAREIVSKPGIKFVMIAGPSSSGKTSFSHRLSIQLQTLGKFPHPIGMDDYYVNREDTPRDENGDYNFECVEAIDTKQFNEDMSRLLAGERVEMPHFNFKTGLREYNGTFMQLGPDDILVIEGIHGLNERTSYLLPDGSKFKIYISSLTSLNLDSHNRIPTTDGRLLRRMVRDARTRGTSAKRTIEMWPSVRRGEEEYIFPFQEDADAMFNSALVYELAALKIHAEPLLFGIEKGEKEYFEAKRMLKFLGYFLGIPCDMLPNNSLGREFVGGSCFNV